ncbi:MAG TPA: hypothetical protein VGQ69_13970 [Gemmatimonadales bacterium]|jgi:hypothetical protein|nr:hypothetical protein [Gemmatimonadales bacterium]
MTGMPIPRTRGAMIKDAPDHHDAELVLRLYELRREATMREARRFINSEFWPASAAELLEITKQDHPQSAAFRQVASYWEMAYGMAKHGIVNPDYLVENADEGLYLLAKVHPWLAEYRTTAYPSGFRHAEWIATQCEAGRAIFAWFRERVAKRLAAKRGA